MSKGDDMNILEKELFRIQQFEAEWKAAIERFMIDQANRPKRLSTVKEFQDHYWRTDEEPVNSKLKQY